ncbi:MAG: hypothetical protein J7K13_00230 [Thermoplasmata archaeon]|nr:hypothetical protein [Thermoplasmata archaeon]
MNETEIKKQIKSMVGEYLPILKANNNTDNNRESLFYSVHTQDNTIVKVRNESEMELFNAPINFLINQKFILENFSERFIQNKVLELYHKLLVDESKIDEYIDDLIKSISEENINNFFVASEIENIRILDDQEYTLADSTIKIMKEEDLPFENPIFTDNLIGKPSIFTGVSAGDGEKAREKALHNFMISFNLLRLYFPTFKPTLRGCLRSGVQNLVVYNETKGETWATLSIVGDLNLNSAYLNEELYDKLRGLGIEELRKNSSISKIAKECLYWYGLGLDEKYPSAKLLNFVTVLESVLKRKEEVSELRRTVSERGAILLYDQFEERKKAVKQLKEIYDTRSRVVHTGTLIGDEDIALLAGDYARKVLMELIRRAKEFDGDFSKFIDCIDDMKLKGR